SYGEACGGGTCIPQAGTTQRLDSLADRLMYRLAYRNFGDHQSLVVDHSVTVGSSVGVRWYELRVVGGNPTVYQQGTYAPDSGYRWMGSVAMDQSGNIGLGFSISSSTLHPGIHYTGRLAGDAAGTMTQGEGTIVDGAGSQTGNRGLTRWGDYSAMTVDPTDGCTFWYTNEYIPANGEFNWKTRIGTFKLPGCGNPSDFTIGASPSSVSASQGGSASSAISTAVVSGSAETVALSASGMPSGTTASLDPNNVTAGGGSTLTLVVGSATAPGTYSVSVTGTAASASHSTTYTVTVTGAASSASHTTSLTLTVLASDFSMSASPSSVSAAQGGSAASTIATAVTSGAPQSVSLSASGLPVGTTATFSPSTITS